MGKVTLSWLVLAFLATCHADQSALKEVANGNNQFSTQLYDAIRKSSKDNLIVSPISVSTVLAMIQAGARGSTANSIRTSLRFPQSDQQLNLGYQTLLQELKSDDSVTLEMANKIFPAKGYKLNPTFTETAKKYYNAEPQQLDYGKPEDAAAAINSFVTNATRDKIQDLIQASDLDSMTRLVLVNAIYFKGTWKNQFPTEDTEKMDFYLNEHDTVKVDMMRLETEMPYGEIRELDAKVVSLPYKGDRLSMVILLPNRRTGLERMEEKLKDFPLEKIMEQMRDRKVQLYLPKFKLESTIDLKDPLSQLGLANIFSEKADFSGIPDASVKEDLYVSKAIQKAFIEVNEQGSEAAAATGVAVQSRSGVPQLPTLEKVHVEHGFFAMIFDKQTETPLFLTAVADATQHQTRSASLRHSGAGRLMGSSSSSLMVLLLVPVILLKFFQ